MDITQEEIDKLISFKFEYYTLWCEFEENLQLIKDYEESQADSFINLQKDQENYEEI